MKKRTIIVFALAVLACMSIFSLTACTKSYNVSFETNGGQAIAAVKVKENETYVLPEAVKENCIFDGWYLNKELTGSAITSIEPAADVTVYAKWANVATITLNANGGSVSATSVKVKEGDNVYQAVKDLIPTKTDNQFAYWTVNGKELSKNLTASASGVTLTAKYKVKYEVNILKQGITDDGKAGDYEAPEVVTGYAFAGTDFDVTENHVFAGFYVSEATHDDQKTEAVISENSSENVFKVYYDRRTLKVRFFSEYPESSLTEKIVTKDVLFGAKLELPVKDFVCSGYMLSGWRDVENDVIYTVNSVSEKLFDPETQKIGASAEIVKIDLDQNTDLRAVWSKGIPDMYGGYDTLFLTKDNKVYVQRGDVFFKCTLEEDEGERIFLIETEKGILEEGKIFEGDLYFAYSSSVRSQYSPTKFVSGVGFDESEIMQFGKYNEVTYYFKDKNGAIISEKTSHGTYEVNENGYYVATFTDGELNGKTITFNIGTASNRSAFQLRNEEEAGYGVMHYYYAYNGQLVSSEQTSSPTRLLLSGFGMGLFYSGGSTSYVYYSIQNEILTLQSSAGQSIGTFKLLDATDGSKGFVAYNSSLDATFSFEDGKGSLKTDGVYKAEYTDENGKTTEGTYTVSGTSVVFGGTIVKFSSSSLEASLIISVKTETKIDIVDGKPTAVQITKYYLDVKNVDYTERSYYGKDSRNRTAVNSNLVIVLNENEKGEAAIYVKVTKTVGETSSTVYEKINYGTYALNADNLYELTLTGYNAADGEITGVPFSFDFEKLKSVVYDEASVSSKAVAYWYSYTLDTEKIENMKKYTNTDTETGGTIQIIDGAVAIVTVGSTRIVGSVSTDEKTKLTTIAGSTYYYCVLNEEAGTFTAASRPFGAYVMERYGSANQYFYIEFDGMGGATYHYLKEIDGQYEKDAKGNYVEYTFKGTYREVTTEKLTAGNNQYPVYIFETNEYMGEENSHKEIKFARIILNNYYFAIFYRAEESGATYETGSTLEKLVLDGYLVATYTDEEGNESTGIYRKLGDEITFYGNNRNYYFVVDGDRLVVKGIEYGTYYVIENQASKKGYWVTLNGDINNGVGTATVFVYETDENGNVVYENGTAKRKTVSDSATYTLNSETGKVVLTFNDGAAEITYEGMLGTVKSGNNTIPVFAIIHEEMAETYVEADSFNVLVLDSAGNAVFFGEKGTAKTGYYTLISDSILFFMTSDGSSSGVGVYKYDRVNHTVAYQEAGIAAAGVSYFTEEFESLFFTPYGIAQIEGESNYFFEYNEVSETVTLFKQDPSDSSANAYGFVNKGTYGFGSTIELNSKQYIKYEGRNLVATRNADEQNKYPFRYNEGKVLYDVKDFSFRPTGKTFEVTATVTLSNRDETDTSKKEQTVSATVVRKTVKVKDGVTLPDDTTETDYTEKTATYLRIGYFEFDLALSFAAQTGGDGKATFSVQGARMVKSGKSAYVINTAVYMQMFGMDATAFIEENEEAYGEMSVIETLDEKGEVVNKAASGKFGNGTKYADAEGNNLSFENASDYTYNGSYYTIGITGKDGVDYRMNFSFGATYSNAVGYTMNAFTRVQTEVIEGADIKLVIERTLVADSKFKAGDLFNTVTIYSTKGGVDTEIKTEVYYAPELAEGETGVKYAFIARTRGEDGKILTSTHYVIHLADDEGSVQYPVTSSSGTVTYVKAYELVSFETKEMNVYYDANGQGTSAGRYVEIDKDHNVIVYAFDGGSAYLVASSTYDAETGVYTIAWELNGNTAAIRFTVNEGKFTQLN